MVVPVLTYGSETWTLTKKDEYLLSVTERNILRRIFGGVLENDTWRRRTNGELYQVYGHPNIVTIIKLGRLRWAGHIARADNSYPPKNILSSTLEGRRRRGRPKLRWLDGIEEDARRIGARDWRRAALDRDGWRRLLEEARIHEGL